MDDQAHIGAKDAGDRVGHRAFEHSLLPATRAGGLLGAALVLVLFPLWGWFDEVLEPALAPELLRARWIFMVPIAIASLCIWRGRLPQRPLYLAIFAVLVLPELAIAWMIPQVVHLEAYLIGFSLILSGTCALMVLPMRWTLSVMISSLAFVAAMLWLHPRPPRDIAIIVFFVGTITLINGAVAWLLQNMRLTQFRTLRELESQRRETDDLLQQVVRLSNEDDLTGLANRRRFRRELDEAVQTNLPLSAAIIDMDGFKEINDRHGHLVGDATLVKTAQLLRAEFASSGIPARLGGDEFAVLLQLDNDLASRVAKVQRQVATGLGPELGDIATSLSIGVAIHLPGESAQNLLRRADKALYLAKKTRNCLCVDGQD